MGGSGSKFKWPGAKYIKNFNIENRTMKKLDEQEKAGWLKMAPRHPSTANLLKELEEKAPKLDEYKDNKQVIEASRGIKILGKGPEHQEELLPIDKRPRKENEIAYSMSEPKLDLEYEKYGYTSPAKIKPGNITLRQFDEFINKYKQKKSIELINQFASENKVDVTSLHILLEYYKPFVRLNTQEKGKQQQASKKQIAADSAKDIFPNLN